LYAVALCDNVIFTKFLIDEEKEIYTII